MWLWVVLGVVALVALVFIWDWLFPFEEVYDGDTRLGSRRRFKYRKKSAEELAAAEARRRRDEERMEWVRSRRGCSGLPD